MYINKMNININMENKKSIFDNLEGKLRGKTQGKKSVLKRKTNGLAIFDLGNNSAQEKIKKETQVRNDLKELEQKKFFKSLVWDKPYHRYGQRYSGKISQDFTENDARDFFRLLNKIRIDLNTYQSVQLCINNNISNGSMQDASRKFLNYAMFSLIGAYKFKEKHNPGKYELPLAKLKKRAIDNAVLAFKSHNKHSISASEIENICQKGEYAYQVFEDAMEECSAWFLYRFDKIFKRYEKDPSNGPNPVKAYHNLMHSGKIQSLIKPLETMAGFKGYLSDILKTQNP